MPANTMGRHSCVLPGATEEGRLKEPCDACAIEERLHTALKNACEEGAIGGSVNWYALRAVYEEVYGKLD